MSTLRNIKLEYYKAFALKEVSNKVEAQNKLQEEKVTEILKVIRKESGHLSEVKLAIQSGTTSKLLMSKS
jgi:hypothetical protein